MLKFERADGRYYYIAACRERLMLTICRGGKRIKVESQRSYDSMQALDKDIQRITKRRLNHGYSRVSHDEIMQN